YGGEAFVIIFPMTNECEIRQYGAFLCQIIRQHQWVHNMLSYTGNIVTVSIWVVSLTPSNETGDELLDRVDQALYHAKQSGRNQIKYWLDT
ncbi:diguanylate cyclase, partial [Plesiomonas shigelloides]